MKTSSLLMFKKRLLFISVFLSLAFMFCFGTAVYRVTPAYSFGFRLFNIWIGSYAPSFAFSFGEGVNAYYAPAYNTYIYGYNGTYYRWYNDGWLYASGFQGQWYPLTMGMFIPGILAFGPPPPIMNYRPYYDWWMGNISPWYRTHHRDWWERNHGYMNNYGTWRSHSEKFYKNRPAGNWGMKQMFGRRNQGNNYNPGMKNRGYGGNKTYGNMNGGNYNNYKYKNQNNNYQNNIYKNRQNNTGNKNYYKPYNNSSPYKSNTNKNYMNKNRNGNNYNYYEKNKNNRKEGNKKNNGKNNYKYRNGNNY